MALNITKLWQIILWTHYCWLLSLVIINDVRRNQTFIHLWLWPWCFYQVCGTYFFLLFSIISFKLVKVLIQFISMKISSVYLKFNLKLLVLLLRQISIKSILANFVLILGLLLIIIINLTKIWIHLRFNVFNFLIWHFNFWILFIDDILQHICSLSIDWSSSSVLVYEHLVLQFKILL